jgi:hypothetical protein
MITRSQIKAIGKRLRETQPGEELRPSDLAKLNDWRAHHAPTLNYFADLLKEIALSQKLTNDQFTITQRLKRMQSIILKLKRYTEMQLSMMDDIGGGRIVLPDEKEVYKFTDHLKQRKFKHKFIKINNYISNPKSDGYRSIHLVYRIEKTPHIFIEIQVRSHLQHIWATGVEVFGTLIDTSFKSGEGNNQWKEFFRLLSSWFATQEKSPVLKEHEHYSQTQIREQLIKKIRNLNIIEQLHAYTSMFTSNWRDERSKGRSGKYALLTLNTNDNTTKVTIYAENKLHQALVDYSIMENEHSRSNNKMNTVLVNLGHMEQLERAYPNYFMDTKILSTYLSKIILNKV